MLGKYAKKKDPEAARRYVHPSQSFHRSSAISMATKLQFLLITKIPQSIQKQAHRSHEIQPEDYQDAAKEKGFASLLEANP